MSPQPETPRFKSPAEELGYLRERVEAKEETLKEKGFSPESERIVREEAERYGREETKGVLEKKYALKEKEAEQITLGLIPEEHDMQMKELLSILETKGLKNALTVLEKLDNPHLEDDFHRMLVQYVKHGQGAAARHADGKEWLPLKMTLYEVTLPGTAEGGEGAARPLKELLSGMEQFYAGMQNLGMRTPRGDAGHYTLELALPGVGEELIFYAAVPDSTKELFEKQVLAVFPKAEVREQKNDYNIFTEGGATVGAEASFARKEIFPLKTYDQFDYDPLHILLNAFSNIKEKGEGAAIQLVVRPVGDVFVKKYQEALFSIKKGASVEEATNIPYSVWQILKKEFGAFFLGKRLYDDASKKTEEKPKPPSVDQMVVENIERKVATPIVAANLRIVVSAGSKDRAEEIRSHIESAFNQFENTRGNALLFKEVSGWRLRGLLHDFSFRDYRENARLELSLRELTSLLHFPQGEVAAPKFKQTKAAIVPLPIEAVKEGTLLGINRYRNAETNVYLGREDRLRHFYCIGQTGTGKTTLLKNMIIEDMRKGEGVCMIDPHGSDILDVLSLVPLERQNDVIYFDPSYTARAIGLNMLEVDERYPEQKTFVVNELFSIFQKLYGAVPESMGPMFEQYFRNAALLVLEDPGSGATLLDISRVLSDKTFRALKLSRAKNPVVTQFWREIAEKAGGEQALENIVPYITSKFDVFMANEYLRPIIAQEKSSLNFRKIMDEKKILLVNLAKGRLGDINAHLLGLIIVGKILMAALSRVDPIRSSIDSAATPPSFGESASRLSSVTKQGIPQTSYGASAPRDKMPPFYLYIDEFQNITTDSITTILSEARKYNLSLTMAHQFIAQLEERIRDAVFGNVGSIAAFRVGAEDAEFLEKQFEPAITAHDLINLDNFNAYAKILSGGRPMKPFSLTLFPPEEGDAAQIDALRELSYTKYGRPRTEVEEDIRNRYTTS
ncbi:MAG: TraM recognition domain-containing protein [Parcubacteria group bacterium]|nr:TraM recognition domain-containing protein [Parcubacteria group bacterium]